jgi:haloacetate dehalogenase
VDDEQGAPAAFFAGFALDGVDLGEIRLRVRRGGAGPPVLLLHGHPQTHVMWHAVAPRLAERFTVVAPDLPGYGETTARSTEPTHAQASKRTMAADLVRLMRRLGFEAFAVAGHDRGGRVAYRMALDHPDRIRRLAVLDIVPTLDAWERADRDWILDYWHWAFLAQPAPIPERLLAAEPDAYYLPDRSIFHPAALDDYLRAVHRPEVVHTMCEDYRAGASVDVEIDAADRASDRRIGCPIHVLWSRRDLGRWHDVLDVWRRWAADAAAVTGRELEAGHYLAEEAPDAVADELLRFLAPHRG